MAKIVAIATAILAVNAIIAATVYSDAWYLLFPTALFWLSSVAYARRPKREKRMPKGFSVNLNRTKKLNK